MHHSIQRFAVVAALFATLFAAPAAFAGPPEPPPPPEDEPAAQAPEERDRSESNAAAAAVAYQNRGISPLRYAAGGLVGTFYGLGIGHAINGEWSSTGWIFTVGEVAATGAMVVTLVRTIENPNATPGDGMMFFASAGALTVLRIFEIYDVWTRPKVAQIDQPADTAFAIGPMSQDGGIGALLQFRW